jgi:integrase
MAKPRLRLVTPATVNRTVTVRRPRNGDVRTREHLTEDEVEKLIEAAKNNRHGHRDALMVLLTYRHGLRAAEVVDLRWEQGATIRARSKRILGTRTSRTRRDTLHSRQIGLRTSGRIKPEQNQ